MSERGAFGPTGWTLVVDFGTTSTTAAMVDGDEVRTLPDMPSAVRREDGGGLVAGAEAERSGWAPETVNRGPKRWLGTDEKLVLGGDPVAVADAVAAVLGTVLAQATGRHDGVPPAAAVLTHPAHWTGQERADLLDAAARAGLPHPRLVPEPVAAAARLAEVGVDELVAVYDLGGTCTTAVLRRTASGFDVVAHGAAELGGEHLDDLLVTHVLRPVAHATPEVWARLRAGATETWRRRATELRRGARAAKESLSRNRRHIVHVPAAELDVPVTRAELEELFRPSLAATVDELMATVARGGVTPDRIARYLVVGAGSRIPLVTRLVAEAAGAVPVVDDHAVVLGAVAAASPIPTATPPATPTPTAGSTPTAGENPPAAQIPAAAPTPRATQVPGPTTAPRPAAAPVPARTAPAWRRRAVLLPVGAAAAAVVVAAVTTVVLRDAPARVVDAVSATAASPTPSRSDATEAPPNTLTVTAEAEPSPDPTVSAAADIALTINGPSLVAVGQNEHYTASYTHHELVASCRWTDADGTVVPGCGWLPIAFPTAASYTVRFTVLQTTGETYTVTKTITAG